MLLVEGVDEITGAGQFPTHRYRMGDVLSERRLGDLVSQDPQQCRQMNIGLLNQVGPA